MVLLGYILYVYIVELLKIIFIIKYKLENWMNKLNSKEDIDNKVIHGDVNKVLREFPDNIIDCCITRKI